jgi:hypothetical protein
MSVVDDKLGTWRRVTEQAEPSPELLAAVLEAAPPPAARAPLSLQQPTAALTAAQRLRLLRSGPRARLALWWSELKLGLKVLAFAAAGLLVVAGATALLLPDEKRVALGPEPQALIANTPIEASFGLGEGVDYERADQKVFDFEFRSPVKLVAVLHFQARDISMNEVVVSVNGTPIDLVPADTVAVNERSNELVIPANVLVRNGLNKIAFDHTGNPPQRERWRVWNIWVEVFPLPELGRDELVRLAQEHLSRGQELWDRRVIGAENLYGAWRAFREAWLTLEALEGPHPLELTLAYDKMREAQLALDRKCSQLLLEAQSAYNQKQFEAARMTLEHVDEYFPRRDQPCPYRAEQLLEVYGL